VFWFLICYSAALALDAWRVRVRVHSGWNRLIALAVGGAGFSAQTWYLLIRAGQSQSPPLLSSAHDWVLVLAWLAVLTHLFVSVLDSSIPSGIIVWPAVIALIVGSLLVDATPSPNLDYHRGWKMLHASVLVLGTAAILCGFVLSLLYLWQHRRLKHRQMLTTGLTLPSLERLERYNRWSILVAVPLLTAGVATGIGLAVVGADARPTWTDPVVLSGEISWGLMCTLFLWLITGRRPPGRQVAWLTAWACGFLLLMIVGLQVLTSALKVPSVHANRPPTASTATGTD